MNDKRSFWYQLVDGKPAGPLSVVEVIKKIRSSNLASHDLFFKIGDDKWRTLAEHDEFKSLFKKHLSSNRDLWVVLKRTPNKLKKYEQQGPLTTQLIIEKIEAGEVLEKDYLWQQGMSEWTKISSVPVFSNLFIKEEFIEEPVEGLDSGEMENSDTDEPVVYDEKTIVSVPLSELEKRAEGVQKTPATPLAEDLPPPEVDGMDLAKSKLDLKELKKTSPLFKGAIRLPRQFKKESENPAETRSYKVTPVDTSTHTSKQNKDIKIEAELGGGFSLSALLIQHKSKVIMFVSMLVSLMGLYSAYNFIPVAKLIGGISQTTDNKLISKSKPVSQKKKSVNHKIKPKAVQRKIKEPKVLQAKSPPTYLKVKVNINKVGQSLLALMTDASPDYTALLFFEASAGKVVGVKSVHWYKKIKMDEKRKVFNVAEWSLPEGMYSLSITFDKLTKNIKVRNYVNSKKFNASRRRFVKDNSVWIHKEKKRLFKLSSRVAQLMTQIRGSLPLKGSNKKLWKSKYRGFKSKIRSYTAKEMSRLGSTKKSKIFFPQHWREYRKSLEGMRVYLSDFDRGRRRAGGFATLQAQHGKLLYRVRGLSVY